MNNSMRFMFVDRAVAGASAPAGEKLMLVGGAALILLRVRRRSFPAGQLLASVLSSRPDDALYRTFAETEATPAGIEEFIRRFGPPSALVEQGAVDMEGRLVLFVPKNT